MASATSQPPLLFSVKFDYWQLIEQGLKDAELRRNALNSVEGRKALIYVPSPVMELRGGFTIGAVWTGTPDAVWDRVATRAGVGKDVFEAYYAGASIAYALEITDVWAYERPLALAELRAHFDQFVVPQSWRYLRPEEQRLFLRRKRKTRDTQSLNALRAWSA